MDYRIPIHKLNIFLTAYDQTAPTNKDKLKEIKERINGVMREIEMMVKVDMEDPDKKSAMYDDLRNKVHAIIDGKDIFHKFKPAR